MARASSWPSAVLLLALLLHAGSSADAGSAQQPTSPRIAALAHALERGDLDAQEAFWKTVQGGHTPLIEPAPDSPGEMLVTFVWRENPNWPGGVSVFATLGETTGPVERRQPWPLERLAKSDLWYRTVRMSDRARFSYQFSRRIDHVKADDPTNVELEGIPYELFIDALNPKRFKLRSSAQGEPVETSYAEGPRAPTDLFFAQRPVPRGQVQRLEYASAELGNRRFVSVYTPPGAAGGCAECALLVLFDAEPFESAVPTATILDNLLAAGLIRPTVAILIGNVSPAARIAELRPDPRLTRFVTRDLLPWVRERYRFTRDPRYSVIAGSSLGGLAATYIGFEHPEMFGNVISLSGAHWWWPGFDEHSDFNRLLNADSGWLTHAIAQGEKRPLRFYLDVGTWEGAVMLLPNRLLRDVLIARGYEVDYHEFVGGHDYVCWRSALAEGLIRFLGQGPGSSQGH